MGHRGYQWFLKRRGCRGETLKLEENGYGEREKEKGVYGTASFRCGMGRGKVR